MFELLPQLTQIAGLIISFPVLHAFYLILMKCNIIDTHELLKRLVKPVGDYNYADNLVDSFTTEIDNIIEKSEDRSEKEDLKRLKKDLTQKKTGVKDVAKIVFLSVKDRQETFFQLIKDDLLNYPNIKEETKKEIIKQFGQISINKFREYAKKDSKAFQVEVLEGVSKLDDYLRAIELENYNKLCGYEVKLDQIGEKLSGFKREYDGEIKEKYPETFATLHEKCVYQKVDLCKIYSSLNFEEISEDISKKIEERNKKLLEEQQKYLCDGIQVSIQRGRQFPNTIKKSKN